MKKFLPLLMALLLLAALAACGAPAREDGDDKLRIVATAFPQYDWTRRILGEQSENIELTLLVDNGVDLHSYLPSVGDIAEISDCDLFIHVGGESEAWVADTLKSTANENRIVLSLLDLLGGRVKEEELIEGMEHDHEHEDGHGHEHHDEPEIENGTPDEHVWLSLKNAQAVCGQIAETLGRLDPLNAELYASNAGAYIAELAALDAEYQSAVDSFENRALLFGDRFPFRYLADDYGLTCYAAFPGCSAETEAGFETIIFLANKLDELNLGTVMVLEGSGHSIAEAIIRASNGGEREILAMDSMQSVTAAAISSGVTYLSIMASNLEVLKEALS